MKERTQHSKSNREADRQPFGQEVTVTFQAEPLSGSGKNISSSGVYFIADQDVQVSVRIGDRDVVGQLVRVENHGRGRTGIAIKFPEGTFDVA